MEDIHRYRQQLRDHVLRMDNTRLPKIAYYYKPKQTGDDGKP
jgi:hypothetical protein